MLCKEKKLQENKKSLFIMGIIISGTLVGILVGMLIEIIDDNKFHINTMLELLSSKFDGSVLQHEVDNDYLTTK